MSPPTGSVGSRDVGGREHDSLDGRALEVEQDGGRGGRRCGRRRPRAAPPSSRRHRRRSRRPRRPSEAGSSCSWIQTIQEPSGARDGSTAMGWPQTIVASAGRSPRSASLTARETPSRPGVTWTIAVRAEPLVPLPVRAARTVRSGSASRRARSGSAGPRPRCGGKLALEKQAAVELRRRDAGDDRALRGDHARRRPAARQWPARRRPGHARRLRRSELAARIPDDPREGVHQPDAAALRHGHPAELDGDARSPGS